MTEPPGVISRLLSELHGLDPPPAQEPPRLRIPGRRRLDSESKARLIDASLGVIGALRVLADVAEDVLMDRRERLGVSDVPDQPPQSDRRDRSRRTDPKDSDDSYQRIPLTY